MIFWEFSKITDFQGSRDLSRAVKFSHGDHAQNRGVRDKSRDLGTLPAVCPKSRIWRLIARNGNTDCQQMN